MKGRCRGLRESFRLALWLDSGARGGVQCIGGLHKRVFGGSLLLSDESWSGVDVSSTDDSLILL